MATVDTGTESDELEHLLEALEHRCDEDELRLLEGDEHILAELHRHFREFIAERYESVESQVAWLHDTHPLFMLEHWGHTTNESTKEKVY